QGGGYNTDTSVVVIVHNGVVVRGELFPALYRSVGVIEERTRQVDVNNGFFLTWNKRLQYLGIIRIKHIRRETNLLFVIPVHLHAERLHGLPYLRGSKMLAVTAIGVFHFFLP